MNFRTISFFISNNISSKVILKYQASILTCLSRLSQNPFQSNKNSESSITNRKLQKYVSVSICHCHIESFMKSLFIAYRNDERCHFVVHISSPALISCVLFLSISLFFLIFFRSLLLAEVLR